MDRLTDLNNTTWTGFSAPVYAAAYGRREVYDRLAPLATAEVIAQAEIVWRERQAYLDELDDDARRELLRSHSRQVRKPPAKAEREALLAEHPKLKRWIVQCIGCQRQGYKPTMPEEIDRQGTAAEVRRLFQPLELTDYLCQRCSQKAEKATRAAEAKVRQAMASLPPHVKIRETARKPRKKRSGETDTGKPGETNRGK
jgi:hypothetical protein